MFTFRPFYPEDNKRITLIVETRSRIFFLSQTFHRRKLTVFWSFKSGPHLRFALVANYIMMNSDMRRMIAITFSAILFSTSTAAILCALCSSAFWLDGRHSMSGDVEHNRHFKGALFGLTCVLDAVMKMQHSPLFFPIETHCGATNDGLPQREKRPCNQWGPFA